MRLQAHPALGLKAIRWDGFFHAGLRTSSTRLSQWRRLNSEPDREWFNDGDIFQVSLFKVAGTDSELEASLSSEIVFVQIPFPARPPVYRKLLRVRLQ